MEERNENEKAEGMQLLEGRERWDGEKKAARQRGESDKAGKELGNETGTDPPRQRISKVAWRMTAIEGESKERMKKWARMEEEECREEKTLAVYRFLLHYIQKKKEKQGMQGRDKRKLIKEALPKKRGPVFSILLALWRLIFMS